ncbi:hypothetical protein FA13DRAFT_1769396, partial [Coprinellus micaceus]
MAAQQYVVFWLHRRRQRLNRISRTVALVKRKDITIELPDTNAKDESSIKLGTLHAFDLAELSPGKWIVKSPVELPQGATAIDCVLSSDDMEDIDLFQLDCQRDTVEEVLGTGFWQQVEVFDSHLPLRISWRIVKIPLEVQLECVCQAHARVPFVHSMEFLNKFRSTGNLADISEAIATMQRAVDTTPEGDANLHAMLSNLGGYFMGRFQRGGDIQDVAQAISNQQKALQVAPADPNLPSLLNNLGNSFLCRFMVEGDFKDIAEATRLQNQSVQLTPRGHPDLPSRLSNLGASLMRCFECTGDLNDVTQSIEVRSQAVCLTPDGHEDLPWLLSNLGSSFQSRFEHTGDLLDVAEAIRVRSQAVLLTPESHADLPGVLGNLGAAFLHRFQRTDDLHDIAEAISAQNRAVQLTPQLTPDGHADLPGLLSNLGGSYLHRFQCTGDLHDVGEAIKCRSKAVRLTPEGHADLPSMLSYLGNAFRGRFKITGDLGDIIEAIAAHTKAVRLTPEGHSARPSRLNNLGNSLHSHFGLTDALSDFTGALSALTEAVRLTPDGHQTLPSLHHNLGPGVLPQVVFQNTWMKASLLIVWQRLILPEIHEPEFRQQQNGADSSISISPIASRRSRHMMLGRPQKALEWLEQGRCLVWGQQNQLRTPLDDLRAHDATLADRVTDTARKLEKVGSSSVTRSIDMHISEKISLENEARNHLDLAREWEELLAAVRDIPAFSLVQDLPVSGHVVIINMYVGRCDAIALRAGWAEPLHIPLPHFSWEKANKLRRALNIQVQCYRLRTRGEDTAHEDEDGRAGGLYRRKETRDESSVHMVLKRLWNEVVKPILDTLGLLKRNVSSSSETLPRIWWCPTGPLSFLPIHAAGIYQSSEADGIMNYAVSSYTPTVAVLTQRVKRDRPIDRAVSGLFLTCQPEAPGAATISGTTEEVRSLHDRAPKCVRSLKLEGGELTVSGCLENMEHYSSIHLACHASQEAGDPLQSRFLFHNGKLTLSTIMRSNLQNADLAFLSACETSTGAQTLADEAVHLAAGMLAAGYRRVVATMWAIGDTHAPQVANDFYEYLWSRRKEGNRSIHDTSPTRRPLIGAQDPRDLTVHDTWSGHLDVGLRCPISPTCPWHNPISTGTRMR